MTVCTYIDLNPVAAGIVEFDRGNRLNRIAGRSDLESCRDGSLLILGAPVPREWEIRQVAADGKRADGKGRLTSSQSNSRSTTGARRAVADTGTHFVDG